MKFLNLLAVLAMLVVAPISGFTTQPASRSRKSTKVEMVAGSLLQKTAVKVGAMAVRAAALGGTAMVKLVLDKPSRTRTYGEGTVADEYDEWTEEGILEYYWGSISTWDNIARRKNTNISD
jgi:hypothetical protein